MTCDILFRKRRSGTWKINDAATPASDYTTFSNPGYGAENPGHLEPPLTDSIAMASNVNPMVDMGALSNPTYEEMENPGVKDMEKKEAQKVTPENQYDNIPAVKNREPFPTEIGETEKHLYESPNWEKFDPSTDYENFSGGKLTLKVDQPEDTTA
jgi:hypothetical protein